MSKLVLKKRKVYVLLVSILIIILGLWYNKYSNDKSSSVLSKEGITFGDDTAKIKVHLYTSFSCKNCKMLNENICELLKQKIEEKELQLIYKPTDEYVYLWEDSIFYSYDYLSEAYVKWLDFSQQSRMITLSDKEQTKRDEIFKSVNKEMDINKIQALPTFFINGKRYVGSYSKDDIESFIMEQMNE